MADTVDLCDCTDSENPHVHVMQIRDVAREEGIELAEKTEWNELPSLDFKPVKEEKDE